METNNHQINDYSAVLERKYGKHGTQERARKHTLSIQAKY